MCSKPMFCSKIALKGKTCSRLLKPQKVAPNAKSCSKVAERNRDRPTPEVEIRTRPNLYHFARYLVKAKLFCRKCFVPVTGLECSCGKIFIPATEISVAKTEISVTGPTRPLIWTHRYFYKEKSGEATSRKPSQPGWPGSYEEALSLADLLTKRSSVNKDAMTIFGHLK